ncbi:MAG: tRNA (adenosine(37)-N6)-threonylcarbamoyltransferase complex transferase subunit TsaD [Desulfobacteraceae bacterium]|jgi:N6-L-threonylcarbamoyladenine synthase
MRILGIESSCDETAAAVVEGGRQILSSVVATQVQVHHPYGGVVPELASRKHIEAIVPVVEQAIAESGVDRSGIEAVAATQGPGLVGALLVGFSFAKAYAYGRRIPFIGVDHLEGHISSVLLSDTPPPFPFVALLASGGHTAIYHVTAEGDYTLLGQTRDDAAGEAYDKVAKMLGLGYPGGVVIDQLAMQADSKGIEFPRPFLDKEKFDFSFSGIKTAVHRHIQSREGLLTQQRKAEIAAGFQAAVVDVLAYKLLHAAKIKKCRHVAVVGGVAANQGLKQRLLVEAADRMVTLHIPPISLCGDNAAMIAAAAYHHLQDGAKTPIRADVYSRHLRTPQRLG